jgi:hypothetical protein
MCSSILQILLRMVVLSHLIQSFCQRNLTTYPLSDEKSCVCVCVCARACVPLYVANVVSSNVVITLYLKYCLHSYEVFTVIVCIIS